MITVLGSINVDIVLKTSQLPAPGETVCARVTKQWPVARVPIRRWQRAGGRQCGARWLRWTRRFCRDRLARSSCGRCRSVGCPRTASPTACGVHGRESERMPSSSRAAPTSARVQTAIGRIIAIRRHVGPTNGNASPRELGGDRTRPVSQSEPF